MLPMMLMMRILVDSVDHDVHESCMRFVMLAMLMAIYIIEGWTRSLCTLRMAFREDVDDTAMLSMQAGCAFCPPPHLQQASFGEKPWKQSVFFTKRCLVKFQNRAERPWNFSEEQLAAWQFCPACKYVLGRKCCRCLGSWPQFW